MKYDQLQRGHGFQSRQELSLLDREVLALRGSQCEVMIMVYVTYNLHRR